AGGVSPVDAADAMAAARRQTAVAQLINAYRVRGHKHARIDPLGRQTITPHPELDPGFYGLSEADLDVPVSGRPLYGVPEVTTPRHIVTRLKRAYCSGFGVEFMNIGDISQKRWLQERIETLQDTDVLDREQEIHALRLLADAENFERLLHNRFPGTKRFSVEGAETLVPLLDFLFEAAGKRGVDEAILGMAHRGRLNVLANILEKPVQAIVSEFEGGVEDGWTGSGDVKYHLGYSAVYTTVRGDEVLLSLAFNPSHLEAVDPVVEGRARARQDRRGGDAYRHVMPVLIHGDAAFAGQGVVAETLNLSDLRGYRTGGSVHVIINNQIGFTTSPKDARSTDYCTDVARMLQVPIFHVNGEDVEAVAAVARLAAEWRQTYHQDVVIDMYCYRKHGHNEGDEPSFTQPLLYDTIRAHPSPRVVYARKMVDERGDLTQQDVDRIVGDSLDRLEAHLRDDAEYTLDSLARTEVAKLWSGYGGKLSDPVDTRVDKAALVDLLRRANAVPDSFNAHRKIKRLLKQRMEIVEGQRPVDWAVAEQAAFASLVAEGTPVRLSGQDSGRGTFSHRHASLTDSVSGEDYVPLDHLTDGQARFRVIDSLLSEAAVLGFEYGYTLESPDSLVLWEAQFGDFANGAQVIFDNFISSGEQKWQRCSGVVMLLPHGYEGQGPEHSSARLERYLQCCAEDNMVVANCTTPANFFHLLRRQALQRVRKPLIVMSPKSLLRHPECISTIDDLADGAFQPVIPETDADVDAAGVERVVLCSGKLYYELRAARRTREIRNVALLRLDRLYPLPAAELSAELAKYGNVEVVWCQEEPRNMGAWPMMDEWLVDALAGRAPRYVGRPAAAATATGFPAKHKSQQESVINDALTT
ncbi:MAG: 2-oxoglutarate dehydrogenase E1 component, partial [Myxococcota bacterium]|nr:2-oxoglutarate dehydrogenase E1 component [Myxococcota bacterium]